MLYDIIQATWECDEDKFTCGKGYPRCISQTRMCNKLIDCSDGSDENATRCGECRTNLWQNEITLDQ